MDEEETKDDKEKIGTGARQLPVRWCSLSHRWTGRLPGGVLGWRPVRRPCASATKASHRCHAGKRPKGLCWFLCRRAPLCARGATVRRGHQPAREKEMAERPVVEKGGHL